MFEMFRRPDSEDDIGMTDDERSIRDLVATWFAASKTGNLQAILDLMTDDVIFMVPGSKPFGKETFAAAFAGMKQVRIEGRSDIQELHVLGDWAYLRNYIEVTATPQLATWYGAPVIRSQFYARNPMDGGGLPGMPTCSRSKNPRTKLIQKQSAALRTASELIAFGLAPNEQRRAIEEISKVYATAVTETIANLIDRNDPADPIARQFIPDPAELIRHPEEMDDPTGDEAFMPVKGIVHRYPDRVLLKLLHICPVYCRFCFRRMAVGQGDSAPLSSQALDEAIKYIAEHPAIWEVILTGGDPLTLSLRRLAEVMRRLRVIAHVKILRLHTRVPVADPEKVTRDLPAILLSSGKTVYVALHANHPRELSEPARAACARLIDAGISMVSQSVLLAGVNDNIDTLAALMRAFVEARIKPYYLHQLDPAPGTAHFRVPIERGQELMRQLHGRVSGLCQPHYVLDIPGGYGKSPIGPNYLTELAPPGVYEILDYQGRPHRLPQSC
jgi:lysine 2,3-aminomutase